MAETDKQKKLVEQLETETKILKGTMTISQYLEKIAQSDKMSLESVTKKYNELKKITTLQEHAKKISQDELKDLEKRVGMEKDLAEKLRLQLELAKRKYKEAQNADEIDEKNLETLHAQVTELEKQTKALSQNNEKLSAAKNYLKEAATNAQGLTDALTGGVGGKLVNSLFTISGVISLVSEAILGATKRQEQYTARTGILSSAMGKLGINLNNISPEFQKYSLTLENTNESLAALQDGMSNFTKLTEQQQSFLKQHTAALKNIGISSESVARNYNTLTKAMHVSNNEVSGFTDRLIQHAYSAGISPKKMIDEFEAAAPRLAVYGKKAEQVFIDLQKQAKSLGMEMTSLTSIVGDQFDTFEGSARAAGRLNAILGGNYLNSVEMLNASEEERVMILKRSMEASGIQFSTLDKHSQRAIASALNIGNLAEANKFFSETSADMDKDLKKQAVSQDDVNKALMQAAPIMNQVQAALERIITEFKPLGLEISSAAKDIKDFMTELNNPESKNTIVKILKGIMEWGPAFAITTGIIMPLVLGIGGAFFALRKAAAMKKMFTGLAEGVSSISKSTEALSATMAQNSGAAANLGTNLSTTAAKANTASGGLNTMSTAAGNAGRTAGAGASRMRDFGLAVLFVGAGIGLAAYGLSKLVLAFKDLKSDQQKIALAAIVAVMLGMVVAIGLLGSVSAAAATPILGVGFGMFLIGAGVGIAVGALALLVKSVGGLFEQMAAAGQGSKLFAEAFGTLLDKFNITNLGLFAKFTSSLEDLADAITKIGEALSESMAGFSLFNGILASLLSISDAKLSSFVGLIAKFSNETGTGVASSSRALAESIASIAQSINSIPDNKKLGIESVMTSVTNASSITEAAIKPAKDFVDAMKSYYTAQANSKTASDDAIVQALREAAKSIVGELQTGRSQPQSVNVNLSGFGGGSSGFESRASDVLGRPVPFKVKS